jgi:hypothetical protein
MGIDPALFVQQPLDIEYICPICHEALEDPVQTSCEHYFCRKCITDALQFNPLCPLDRIPQQQQSLGPLPRGMRNVYLKMKVNCVNHDAGCQEILEVESIQLHLPDCVYAPGFCVYEGCPFFATSDGKRGTAPPAVDPTSPLPRLRRKDTIQHITDCQWKPICCPLANCKAEFPMIKLRDHETTCEWREIECENKCGLMMLARDIQAHVNQACPNTLTKCEVVDCDFKIKRGDETAWDAHFAAAQRKHTLLVSQIPMIILLHFFLIAHPYFIFRFN